MSDLALSVSSRQSQTVRSTLAGAATALDEVGAKQVYFDLLSAAPTPAEVARSRLFLESMLEQSTQHEADIPLDPQKLYDWSAQSNARVRADYSDYLAARQAGRPRRYFTSKAHALYFLKGVAPTKLVDGAWLYGLFSHWQDPRFLPLMQTYLEELGEGDPNKNHVVLYKRLLATHGCDQWARLSDDYFVQGAIQLSLAQHTEHYLPEVIGFNLGYEQLPLHLLITAYELNELGIDPYYFTLHVTVDNAASGHAHKAIEGVLDALPRVGDPGSFYQRIRDGYRLNALGASTNSVIAEFDLERELIDVLAAKAPAGACLHSDYVRVGGKTINEWLDQPDTMPALLTQLQSGGWIHRHDDPLNSRFWRLIEGETAAMHGIFTRYERQVIYDWIAGQWGVAQQARKPTFRSQRRVIEQLGPCCHGAQSKTAAYPADDFKAERLLFERRLAGFADREQAMQWLVTLISPVNHPTHAGLLATQAVCRILAAGQ